MDILKNQDLWNRIAAFPLDNPNSLYPFSKKLTAEQHWTEDFCLRTVAEYKKFLYLALVEPDGASPSPIVDEAWHLHITYTEGYANFCIAIAGRFLHHHPSKGGAGEKERHEKWYAQTLNNYVKHFGYEPPRDIWDVPYGFQFDAKTPIEMPETAFELPNLSLELTFLVYGLCVVLVVLCLTINPYIDGSFFLFSYSLLALTVLISVGLWESAKMRTRVDALLQALPNTFNRWEIVCFLHGKNHLIKTWVLELMENKILEMPSDIRSKHLDLNRLAQTDNLYQNPLYTTLACVEQKTLKSTVLQAFALSFARNYDRLAQLKAQFAAAPYLQWARNIVLLIGITRLVQGVLLQKPIGFLVLLLVGVDVLYRLLKTEAYNVSDKISRFCRARYLKLVPTMPTTSTTSNNFALSGFTLDASILPMLLFWDALTLPAMSARNAKDNGGGGCSSGDGGSGGCGDGGSGGCGGGCGGCGGCGS